MSNLYRKMGIGYSLIVYRLKEAATRLLREERGDLVSSLGWMAIMALALVVVKNIVDGRLAEYANNIFTHLDRIFS